MGFGTTFLTEIMKNEGEKGKMQVKGQTVSCLQRTTGKHAKILQFMCQQHAGIECLARIEMFKGVGRRGLVPKPVF